MINQILPKDVPTSKKDENKEHEQQKCQSSKLSGPNNTKEFKNKSSRNQRKKDKDNARTQEIKDLFKDNEVQDIKNISANQEISKKVDILTGLFTNPEF